MTTVDYSPIIVEELQSLLAAARQEVERLRPFERNYQTLSERFEGQTTLLDVFCTMQRVSWKKVSYAHQKLYNALAELYPDLFAGIPTVINPYKLREAAGWISARTTTSFFSALVASGAITYELQPFNAKAEKDEDKRPALVTPNPEGLPYPNQLDLASTEKLKKNREEAKKKQQEMAAAWRLYQCDKCGSPDIEYGIVPKCKSCGHDHTPMEGIAGDRITIAPVGETNEDDWDAMIEAREADNIIDFPGNAEPETDYFANDMPEDNIPWKKRG